MKCSLGDDRIQLVLWCVHNLPVFLNLKNVVALCGPNNLLLDSPEDIADGILEMPGHLKPTMVMLKICVAPALWWQLVCKLSAIKEVN